MIKSILGMGVALEGILSGLSCGDSYCARWIPLAIGLAATMPSVRAWALAFAHGETASACPSWQGQTDARFQKS
jgi:hypothetical protein